MSLVYWEWQTMWENRGGMPGCPGAGAARQATLPCFSQHLPSATTVPGTAMRLPAASLAAAVACLPLALAWAEAHLLEEVIKAQ